MNDSKKNLQKVFYERFANLNAEQKIAVENIDGPVLVIAGPGSGKTELLSLRTAHILNQGHINPNNILLLTFTDSGARNMRDRMVSLIGETAYRVGIYTFHSFASDVISKYGEYFFEGAHYKPATDIDRIAIIENVIAGLERKNPLSSKHFERGYTYTGDIMSCISAIKKGNMSAEEFRIKIKQDVEIYKNINLKIGSMFSLSSGKRNFEVVRDNYLHIYQELLNIEKETPDNQKDIVSYLSNTLLLELKNSNDNADYKNLNSWRDVYFTKDENGNIDKKNQKSDSKILKDSRPEKIEKWLALSYVYEAYDTEMQKRGLYDFDDMIFLVSRTIQKNVSLRNELEEKYQYIMIDEFQDTNDAQMSLVTLLTSSPINEGRPNVLAVGDDDQAIYKFQGAELSNLYKFRRAYTDVQMIVLDKNYRSTQEILDFARSVITKAEDRLETRFPVEINKKIVSSNTDLQSGNIIQKSFENIHSEMDFIATEIQRLLSDGVNPKEISVISKSHDNLKKLSVIMNGYRLPYSYEKREHVLEKQPIHELVTITKFVSSSMTSIEEDMLPEILSYKFFNLDRIEIWKIAEKVRNGTVTEGEMSERIYKKKNWLTAMLESDNEKVRSVSNFLIELMSDAQSMPLVNLLDKIIGTSEYEVDTQIDDIAVLENENTLYSKNKYTSPFREYYFGQDNFQHNKPEYLDFLFSLRTFIGALREYKQGQMLHASDIFEFLDVYTNNDKLTLMSVSPFATSDISVVLQTAHKSKGLEYEYVFIINSDEDEWNGRGYSNKIGMPAHLKLLPESDNTDDKIRLYYVATTRAKHTLYITHHKNKLGFILNDQSQEIEKSEINKNIVDSLYITEKKEYLIDEKVLLKRLLENYKMPITHVINFLNIGKVGPEKFIEQNLLRFPQAMSPSSVYGSAMHEAMQNYYLYYKKHQELPDTEKLKSYFENALSRGSLSVIEHEKYLKSGYENLEVYISDLQKRGVKPTDMVEVNFANEGVMIGEVQAAGKIDKMEIDGQNIKVTDLKTGKSFSDWENTDTEYDKIKMHFFTYQLAYYYLLIKNSRTYNNYNVEYGYIEFLEADKNGNINILELKLDDTLISRVEKLANIIYKKILNLEFPDTSRYAKNEDNTEREVKLKDILAFEEDLLSGNI